MQKENLILLTISLVLIAAILIRVLKSLIKEGLQNNSRSNLTSAIIAEVESVNAQRRRDREKLWLMVIALYLSKEGFIWITAVATAFAVATVVPVAFTAAGAVAVSVAVYGLLPLIVMVLHRTLRLGGEIILVNENTGFDVLGVSLLFLHGEDYNNNSFHITWTRLLFAKDLKIRNSVVGRRIDAKFLLSQATPLALIKEGMKMLEKKIQNNPNFYVGDSCSKKRVRGKLILYPIETESYGRVFTAVVVETYSRKVDINSYKKTKGELFALWKAIKEELKM